MSQDQSLSTEDLAGRQTPHRSQSGAPPAATGASDPAPPPVTGAVGDDRWTDDTDQIQTVDVSDHDVSDHDVSDHDVSDGDRDAGAADDGQRRPDDDDVSLVDAAQAEEFRARWADVQVRFVDDPKEAVGAADALVAEAMQSLASAFADHKSRLETQWHGGGDVDTEELRVALRRYRSFFHRLLET